MSFKYVPVFTVEAVAVDVLLQALAATQEPDPAQVPAWVVEAWDEGELQYHNFRPTLMHLESHEQLLPGNWLVKIPDQLSDDNGISQLTADQFDALFVEEGK